jgi:KaiC/GvpD/RAD55 family RecA-like ATPase
MRSKTAALLLIVALAMWQPHLSLASTDPVATEVTLYAHTDPSATSVGGRVLSLIGNTTLRQAADVLDGLAFTLVPSLSAPLHILGRIDVYVWLVSQESIRGTLRVTVSELAANASVIKIRNASVTIGVPSIPLMTYFGLGPVDYTVQAGSTLKLEIQFTPPKPVRVTLLWDNPSTSTRMVLDVESIPRIDLGITDSSGTKGTIFPANSTGPTNLIAHVLVEDPFHGTNIQMVSLTMTNSSGFALIKDAPMNLTSRSEFLFQLGYALPMAIPSGSFNVTVSVADAVGRTFVTSSKITVTTYYRLILMLVDLHRRPLADANVSIFAAGQLIDEMRTNSTGVATSRAPSSPAVGGPLTLQIRQSRVLVLSRPIDIESDNQTIQVEVPLSDWNLLLRLQILNLPISEATVNLYLNGTLVASGVSDGNGVAHFTKVPRGSYEIAVASYLASKRFLNVTFYDNETVLELPVLSEIPVNTMLTLAGVAIVTALAAVAVNRRRKMPRRFKHVAELLGGTIPSSAVVMILGPSGSGKSLLLQNILADSLEAGRHCVYASNSELPSKIKEQLKKIGVNAQVYEDQKTLRFIDAYSGATEGASREKHFVPSPTDMTGLGIQLTGCVEELGGAADVFFDSITPIIASGAPARGLDFVRYYGARITKSGGSFAYVTTPAMEPELLSRFEEASDCVLQMERTRGPGKIMGRLLVKKARGLEHEYEWVGFKITSKGRIEFVSLPSH